MSVDDPTPARATPLLHVKDPLMVRAVVQADQLIRNDEMYDLEFDAVMQALVDLRAMYGQLAGSYEETKRRAQALADAWEIIADIESNPYAKVLYLGLSITLVRHLNLKDES